MSDELRVPECRWVQVQQRARQKAAIASKWPPRAIQPNTLPRGRRRRQGFRLRPQPPVCVLSDCSAGVGRTGCFIVIDAMLERIKHEKTVDIYGHVTLMRAQRNYMVQTEDQYVFIHDALLEAVNCGTTEVPARNLYAYIQKLTQIEGGENVTGMELEFKVSLRLLRLPSGPADSSGPPPPPPRTPPVPRLSNMKGLSLHETSATGRLPGRLGQHTLPPRRCCGGAVCEVLLFLSRSCVLAA